LLTQLLRESLAKTFRHQFRLVAQRKPQRAKPIRRRPPPLARWSPYRSLPAKVRSLAAIKHAQRTRDHHQHPEPQRPRHRGDGSKEEFYLYCKRTGQLALFFQIYPGG
jgi:hypothetical protein